MANNVLANAPIASSKKRHTLPIVVLLIVILTIVLVLFGERVFTDLNKSFNPEYGSCRGSYYEPLLMYDNLQSLYSGTQCDSGSYRLYELLLHTAFTLPVLLGAVILYFFTHLKKSPQSYYRGLTWAYLIFAFWILLHLVIELGSFLVVQQKTLGIYIVFFALVVVLTGLVLFLQKKKQLTDQ